MSKILKKYNPTKLIPDSVLNQKQPIGQKLLSKLLDPSNQMFKTLMEIIKTSYYNVHSNSQILVETSVNLLITSTNLIKILANKSLLYTNLMKTCDNPPHIKRLDKVLLAFNPNSMKADHFYNILKLLTLYSWLPNVELASTIDPNTIICNTVDIIQWFCQHAFGNMEKALINSLDNSIFYSFVEIIEDQSEISKILLKSLIEALSVPHQTIGKLLAEMVVGFNGANENINKNNSLGYKISSKNINSYENPSPKYGRFIIHSCLWLISEEEVKFELKELSYELIYRLASSTRSGHATLKYLRSKDFILSNLNSWYEKFESAQNSNYDAENVINSQYVSKSLSWLLKIAALEAYISSKSGATDRVNKLASAIMDKTFILNLLDSCNVYYKKPEPPVEDSMKMFDLNQIQNLISLCQESDGEAGNNCHLVNTEKLFNLIDSEMKPLALTNISKDARNNIDRELKMLLEFINEYNRCQTSINANNMLVNGLRQVSTYAIREL